MGDIFKSARRAIAARGAALQAGFNKSQTSLQSGFSQASQLLQSPITAGDAAQQRFLELMGLTDKDPLTVLQATPGYQFRVDQANKALQRQQAQLGQSLSGTQLSALARLNQGLAADELAAQKEGLNSLIGLAQQSRGQQASLQSDLARALATLELNRGIASANTIGDIEATRTGRFDFSSPSRSLASLF